MAVKVGRIAPQQVGQSATVQLVLEHAPEALELVVRAELLSPPEPRAVILVPRTEDDGYGLAVLCLQRQQEVAHALHPRLELLKLAATRQDAGHDGRVGNVPGRAFGELLTVQSSARCGSLGIARMPRNGDDTATLVVSDDFVVYAGKRHAVKVLVVTQLDAAQVEAHHGRIVAARVLHVAAVSLVLPRQAIERIVLMTHHVTLLLQGLQSLGQQVSSGLLFLFLTTGCHHHGYAYECIYYLLHTSYLSPLTSHLLPLTSYILIPSAASSPTRPTAPGASSATWLDRAKFPSDL